MRIFITGVAGFLGSHLADEFIKDGHQISGIDNLSGGEREHINQEVNFTEADCNDIASVRTKMEGCQAVYHCAATAHEGLSVFSPHHITRNIVSASSAVFSAAIGAGVRRIMFCSSMARYGAARTPFHEQLNPAPQDPYGIGKVAAEAILRNLCDTHGVEYVIAVPHNIIGPRQRYVDPYRNVAAIMINLMLQGRQPTIYGDGTQMRCFSDIADCVTPLKAMLDEPAVAGEIINIGPDEEVVTINELATRIARKLNFDLQPEYIPSRPREAHRAICSSHKAREYLGYRTTVTLDESLDRMIAYVKARGSRPFDYHIPLEIITPATPKTWSERRF
jgi:UDP-glucose 4-epimerase